MILAVTWGAAEEEGRGGGRREVRVVVGWGFMDGGRQAGRDGWMVRGEYGVTGGRLLILNADCPVAHHHSARVPASSSSHPRTQHDKPADPGRACSCVSQRAISAGYPQIGNGPSRTIHLAGVPISERPVPCTTTCNSDSPLPFDSSLDHKLVGPGMRKGLAPCTLKLRLCWLEFCANYVKRIKVGEGVPLLISAAAETATVVARILQRHRAR